MKTLQMIFEILITPFVIMLIRYQTKKDTITNSLELKKLDVIIRAAIKAGRYKAAKSYFSQDDEHKSISPQEYRFIIVLKMPYRKYERLYDNR